MSDVGALVLTLGESTTDRALASLRSQSLPFAEVVVVNGVTPFHRALNVGAESLRSEYFVQVDADFVLGPTCARTLRDGMARDVGITVAPLHDPLIGPISGVKLFRRQCFARASLQDTCAPEMDFCATVAELGWQTRYLFGRAGRRGSHTLGEHVPRYTPDYVFGTYYRLGARYASRRDVLALLWRFGQLRRSAHQMAPVARVAMAHGMFECDLRDVAKPTPAQADSSFLRELVTRRPPPGAALAALQPLGSRSPMDVFDAFLELGMRLRATSAPDFQHCLRALGAIPDPRSMLAEVALGHGAMTNARAPIPEATISTLEGFVAPDTPKLFPRPA